MRILNVRFKNLNSLVGEWEIDLTHPAFTSDGIFAITGPTGAGKTTILDAICLAIYGRTPRLNKVTKSGNEIMSRQTGECYAEVTFETQAGRFRCHWAQHRARRKPEGELQPPKQEIANADTGEIFESKLRGVAEHIESVTGMDFDRFTRSMLLAQGGFAAFLQAAPDERAPILEQITGTEIYSQISIRVHERHREEHAKLEVLRAETRGIHLLEVEEEQACRDGLTAREQDAKTKAEEADTVGKAIVWLTGLNKLRQDIESLKAQEVTLQGEMEAFQPERERLEGANRAAKLDGAYATLTSDRRQQAEDHAALTATEAYLPELEAMLKTIMQSHAGAEQQVTQAKTALTEAQPLIQRVRLLDQTIAGQEKGVVEVKARRDQAATEIEKIGQDKARDQAKLAEATSALEQVEAYLKEHAQDEPLVAGLAGIEAKLDSLIAKQTDIAHAHAEHTAATTDLRQAEAGLQAQQTQNQTVQAELAEAVSKLNAVQDVQKQLLGGRLLREYRAEKESLLRELHLLNQIAELEDHRAQLEDGKPCPLCGAEEHPYAAGNIPTPDASEKRIDELSMLIEQAESQEHVIKTLERAEQDVKARVHAVQQQEISASHHKQSAEKDLQKADTALKKARSEFSELKERVVAELNPFGIAELPDQGIKSILEGLRERRNSWECRVREHAGIEQQIKDIQSELKGYDALIEQQGRIHLQYSNELDLAQNSLSENRQSRQALFSDKDPDIEVHRLEGAIVRAEVSEREGRQSFNEQQQNHKVALSEIQGLKQRIEARTPKLEQLEADFVRALHGAAFADESTFLDARESAEELEALAEKSKKLDDRKIELLARLKDREKQLLDEEAKKVTDAAIEALEPKSAALEAEIGELRGNIAALKHRLAENEKNKERIKAQQEAIDAQVLECRRWDNLHDLIGSADGKKYRNFAQGLTFEMMVGHANRQLQKMTDRYLLIREVSEPLELNVVDNYQAGEIRSTKNLSGGESFIVSLSLALGLSQMASQNVRVDSLFLDEGFGTLDEEALDTALETLSGLQQAGKLIGVISHVSALKERISTQIQVTPQTGGRSQISGPPEFDSKQRNSLISLSAAFKIATTAAAAAPDWSVFSLAGSAAAPPAPDSAR